MGVAGEIVLDLVQQTVHGHGGQQLLGLLDGGQADAGQAAVADVVEAQQGKILRDADAALLGGLDDAQGVGVRGGEDGGVVDGLGEELLRQLVAVLDGGGHKGVVHIARLQTQLLAGRRVAVAAQLVSHAAAPLAEVQDVPMPQLVEILHAQHRAAMIVHRHKTLRRVPQVLAHENGRDPRQKPRQRAVTLRLRRKQDHAVHLAADHQLKQTPLLFQRAQRIHQDDVVPPRPRLAVDVVRQLRHERVGDVRHDQPQQLRRLHHHRPRHRVRRVIHLPAQRQDPLPRLFADLGAARQCPRYRGIGYPRRPRDVLDGDLFHGLRLLGSFRVCWFDLVGLGG